MEAKTSKEDSVTRFLNAADQAYIDFGYQGATIRKICEAASVSLATLHRHWPSKEALFREVFARHFGPIHDEQQQRLDALTATGTQLEAVDILEAFYAPAFRLGQSSGQHSARRSQAVYCRALLDPSPEAKKIVAALIGDARSRVIALLRAALGHLDDDAFFLAINLVFGAYIYPQAFAHQLAVAMNFDDSRLDWTLTTRRVAELVAGGLASGR